MIDQRRQVSSDSRRGKRDLSMAKFVDDSRF